MHEKLLYFAQRAFLPTCVLGETLIQQGCIISEEEDRQGRGGLETRGGVLIRILWKIQTDVIINVKFGDSDADTYKYETMDKLLDC